MIKETVQAVGVTHIVTETGSKTCLGNRQFAIGESVWTHGNFAFGTERNNPAPLIIPTGVKPAEPGHYFLEYSDSAYDEAEGGYYYNPCFRIRQASGEYAEAQIIDDTILKYANIAGFTYDPVTLRAVIIERGTYNHIYIHTIQNGEHTTQTITLPYTTTASNFVRYDEYVKCKLINGELHWSVYVCDFKYEYFTDTSGNLIDRHSGVAAFLDYVETELVNTSGVTDILISLHDGVKGEIINAYNNATLLQTGKTNESTISQTPSVSATEDEFFIIKEMLDMNLGTYTNSSGSYSSGGTSRQFPTLQATNGAAALSMESRKIDGIIVAQFGIYLGSRRVSGSATLKKTLPTLAHTADNEAVNIEKGLIGTYSVIKSYMINADTGEYDIYAGQKTYQADADRYGLVANHTSGINWKADGTDYYYCKPVVTFTGAKETDYSSYATAWSVPYDYGYSLNVEYSFTTTENNSGLGYRHFTTTHATLNDENTWTMSIDDLGYGYYKNYDGFLTLDNDGNIIFYNESDSELYKIDKATKVATLIHNHTLRRQMQMPLIEGFKDAIVASLTT